MALPTSTLLSISGHFKRFHLNDLPNQVGQHILINAQPQQNFFHFYGPDLVASANLVFTNFALLKTFMIWLEPFLKRFATSLFDFEILLLLL